MTRWVGWVIGAALVAAAWVVAAVTPDDAAFESPFPVAIDVGDEGVGRNIMATVTDIRRAETVRADEWNAEGNWIVVDLDAEAVQTELASTLTLATLEVGGRTFRASERPDSLLSSSLAVGIPRSGSLAFELPADVNEGTAVLRLALDTDTRLDSVIVLDFEVGDVDVEATAELVPTDWSTR